MPTIDKEVFVFHTHVDYVSEKFNTIYNGTGAKAKAVEVSIGWYVKLVGSGESFYISDTKPNLKAGDKVKITLELEP